MKKVNVKESKLENLYHLYPADGMDCLSKNRTKMVILGLLGLSPIFCVAHATASDVAHQMLNSKPVVEIVQQNKRVTGTVNDQHGISVPGAAVQVKGATIGTVTDIDGKFELEVPSDAVLVVSFIGMQPQEIPVGSKTVFNVVLMESNIGLDEVVVVGYGTQKKATLTGSISSVGGEELKKVAAVNLSNTLAGKTAGVIANTRSGEPGEDGATIQIRGQGTFGSTSPLIVVDGIADRSFSRLNAEDIESISILKDASAAIYGSRAANGVILVTTKRGKEGRTTLSYSGRVGFSQPTRVPDMLNSHQYMTYINEYQTGHGLETTFNDTQMNWAQNGENPYQYASTNWWDTVSKDWATQTEHSVSVNGGNDKISFYTSAQYMWQDAIYKKAAQDYGQFQLTSNIDAKVGKYIKIGLDIQGRQEKRTRGVFETNYLFDFLMKCKPIYGAYSPDGQYPLVGMEYASTNPAVMVTKDPGETKYTYNYLNVKPTIRLDMDFITKGLYLEGYAAMDFSFRNGKTLNHPYDVYEYVSSGRESEGIWGEYANRRDQTGAISVNSWSDNSTRITLNGRLGYSNTFNEDHKVDAFVAYEQSRYEFSTVGAYRTNYLSTEIPEINAGSDDPEDQSNSGYSTKTARQNIFGRINYGYKDKYLAEVTLRYDGSMNFAPNHRWGLFPGFSAGWVMSEEAFWENLKPTINFFKLKGSWGKMGNDNITAFQYLSQYLFNESNIQFGSQSKGLYLSRTANPLVTWETARTTNLGFSSQFLNGKFSLDVDYFFSKRSDILITRNASVPIYSGLRLPAENIGKMNNKGIEFIASYQDRNDDFSWGVTGNFTFAKNKVVYSDEATNKVEWRRATGRAYGGLELYNAIGIYQTQEQIDNSPHLAGTQIGDLQYEDFDGNGEITADDMRYYDNYSAIPKIIYGFTLNGGWKGIDLNVFFQGQAMAHQLIMPTMNMLTDFYDGRWVATNSAEENAAARWPRACINDSGYMDDVNGVSSTWWLRNAAFLRLKSIEIGYTLPKNLLRNAGIERVRVYLNANNLFTLDHIKVCDPEVASYYNKDNYLVSSGGILGYPLQRTINFGVNVTF